MGGYHHMPTCALKTANKPLSIQGLTVKQHHTDKGPEMRFLLKRRRLHHSSPRVCCGKNSQGDERKQRSCSRSISAAPLIFYFKTHFVLNILLLL